MLRSALVQSASSQVTPGADGHGARLASARQTVLAALALLALGLLLAGWLVLRRPPALARTLPEADAIVYADLRPVRLLTHLDDHPVAHSPDYQHFIDATGILPERDLRQAAFALHRMPDPAGPNGAVGYSEIFAAPFNRDRLTIYLRSISSGQESYAGQEIFRIPVTGAIPNETRTLRVAVLGSGLIAASNMPTPEQMHAIIDRERTPGLFRGGPLLLSGSFGQLPLGATAWGIGQLALPFSESGRVSALGIALPIPSQQPILASLRYTTALHLRLDLLTGNEQTATTQTEALRGMLDLLRALGLGNTATPAPPALAELLRSIAITGERDRTVLRAVIPRPLLREIAGGGPASARP